ncbi:hypothetical protein V3F56_03665 [Moorellaceae bacterium AZ2]
MSLIRKAVDYIRDNCGATLSELACYLYKADTPYTRERVRNLLACGRSKGRRLARNVYRLGDRYILIEDSNNGKERGVGHDNIH